MTTWNRLTASLVLLALLVAAPVAAKEIYEWSETASSNGFPPPDGPQEGMLKSEVNDTMREMMAVLRRAYRSEFEWQHLWFDKTVAKENDFAVRITGVDATADFVANRRIYIDGGAAIQYGIVNSSSYTAGDTVVSVLLDGVATVDALTDEIRVHLMKDSIPVALWFPGLGTVAALDTGTDPGEVPKNQDLGTSSTKDHGTASGEVPLNSDLGAMSLEAIPDYAYGKKTTADQTGITSLAQVTLDGVTDYLATTGADGAKKYRVWAAFECDSVGGSVFTRLLAYMGAAGTTSDTEILRIKAQVGGSIGDRTMHISGLEVTPASGDRISFGMERVSGSGTISVYGSGTSPVTRFGFAWIEEIIE